MWIWDFLAEYRNRKLEWRKSSRLYTRIKTSFDLRGVTGKKLELNKSVRGCCVQCHGLMLLLT